MIAPRPMLVGVPDTPGIAPTITDGSTLEHVFFLFPPQEIERGFLPLRFNDRHGVLFADSRLLNPVQPAACLGIFRPNVRAPITASLKSCLATFSTAPWPFRFCAHWLQGSSGGGCTPRRLDGGRSSALHHGREQIP